VRKQNLVYSTGWIYYYRPMADTAVTTRLSQNEASEERPVAGVAPPAAESAWGSVFTLSNTAIGVGVLAFPYAFRLTGLLGGLLLCLVVATLEHFTLQTLVRAAAHYRVTSYQAVVERSFGPAAGQAGALLLSASIVVYLFGSLAAYLILLGDVFPRLLGEVVPTESIWTERWVSVLVPSLLTVLPLCVTRSLGALSSVSSLSVVALAYTTFAICFRSIQHVSQHEAGEAMPLFVFTSESVLALPMMAFAFQCHVTVVQIFVELEPSPSFLRCSPKAISEHSNTDAEEPLLIPAPSSALFTSPARLIGMRGVVTTSMAACVLGYVMVGASGYAAYPNDVASNVLNSFDDSDPMLQVARLLMGVNGIVSYPVNLFPCRQALDHLLVTVLGWSADARGVSERHLPLTAALFGGSLAVALVVTDLGAVFQLVGGTAGAAIMFIVPGLVAMQLARHSSASGVSAPDCDVQQRHHLLGDSSALYDSSSGVVQLSLPAVLRMLPGAFVMLAGGLLLVTTVLQNTVMKGA